MTPPAFGRRGTGRGNRDRQLRACHEALGLSDSGVRHAIARLETRLGVRLLERTIRSLRLSDEGGRFYAEAAPPLAQMADAALALTGSRQVVRGRLRVEMDPFFSRMVLAPRPGDFLERYPDLSLNSSPPRHRATSLRTALTWEYVSARRPPPG